MKIALIQTNPQSNFKENLLNAIQFIRKAAIEGAQLIICPETFLFMGQELERKNFGQNINAGAFKQLELLAYELQVYIIAGSIDESSFPMGISSTQKSDVPEKFYNTCVTFSPIGKIISLYRKLHLFNLSDDSGKPIYCESDIYKVGKSPNTYEIEIKNETWDALNIICYDIRFPEIIRHLNKTCDVIFVPAAFTWQTGNDHWEILLRARAIENQCFVVACNQTGFSNEGQKRTFGNSMVVDPWGKIIARLGEEEDILFCEISKSEIKKSRAKLPALQDRKIF